MPDLGRNREYTSGDWTIDPVRRELRLLGNARPIGGRAFDIIEILVRSAGQLVRKDELISAVWNGAIVEENALQFHISELRKALGVDRDLLKTEFGRGYRLLGDWTSKPIGAADDQVAMRAATRATESFRNNVPASGSPLIGRATALAELRDLVNVHRSITLVGPGGIGKTALALELARDVLSKFQGDIWIVELAALARSDLVSSAVATVLELAAGTKRLSPEEIARAAHGKKFLLVLDNCEHVIGEAAILVEAILRSCPRATVIATSREILSVEGEHVYRVTPLDVPEIDRMATDEIFEHSAVQLFVARASALGFDFLPASNNAFAIGTICRRLDGIPLAIELAAARAASLGLQEVASRLDDRFQLLTGGRRAALPRQRTLRATVDWSFELLSETERQILCRLAIFPSGFTIDAAIAILERTGIWRAAIVDGIGSLVTKSLLTRDSTHPIGHWRFLETIRAYGLERLSAHDEIDESARHHAEYIFAATANLAGEFASKSRSEWLAEHSSQIDDLRAALDWGFSVRGDARLAVATTVDAIPIWMHLSLLAECCQRTKQALSCPGDVRTDRQDMQLYAAQGAALLETGGSGAETEDALRKCHDLACRLKDADHRLRSLLQLWNLKVDTGEYRAALSIAKEFSEFATGVGESDRGIGDRMMAAVLLVLGDHLGAQQFNRRLLDRYDSAAREADIERFVMDQSAQAMGLESSILWLRGFPEQSKSSIQAALDMVMRTGHESSICSVLVHYACPLALFMGDFSEARRLSVLLLQLSQTPGLELWLSWGRCYAAILENKECESPGHVNAIGKAMDDLAPRSAHPRSKILVCEYATALGLAGYSAEAIDILDSLITQCEHSEEWVFLSEYLRARGDLTTRIEPDSPERGEAFLQRSLEMSRSQGALSFELRAALSLARSLRRRDLDVEARRLVQATHDKFTEGWATADLVAAKDFLSNP